MKGRKWDERGGSAVEYSLLATAIAGILVLLLFSIGAFTGEMFADTCDSMASVSTLSGAATC